MPFLFLLFFFFSPLLCIFFSLWPLRVCELYVVPNDWREGVCFDCDIGELLLFFSAVFPSHWIKQSSPCIIYYIEWKYPAHYFFFFYCPHLFVSVVLLLPCLSCRDYRPIVSPHDNIPQNSLLGTPKKNDLCFPIVFHSPPFFCWKFLCAQKLRAFHFVLPVPGYFVGIIVLLFFICDALSKHIS